VFTDVARALFGQPIVISLARLEAMDPLECIEAVIAAGLEQNVIPPSAVIRSELIIKAIYKSVVLEEQFHVQVRAKSRQPPLRTLMLVFLSTERMGNAELDAFFSCDGCLGWTAEIAGRPRLVESIQGTHNTMMSSCDMADSIRNLLVSLK
jgi:hypothetical protein